MARQQTQGCGAYDAIHGSASHSHTCTCTMKGASGGHKVHRCPTCGRQWGHPTVPHGAGLGTTKGGA
jgi:hypothetical protein